MARVLHVLHTWGVGSHTFVRSTLRHLPGPDVVLCRERLPVEGDGPRAVALGRLTGKAGVAAGIAVAVVARAQVVHAHFAHEIPLAARIAGTLRRPLVVSLHGRDLLVELAGDASVLDAAAAVVVPSGFLADRARAAGVLADRLHVIPSGIELDELPAPPSRAGPGLDVLFVGRFVEKKGPLDAVAAVAAAVARGADVRARVLGSGPLRDDLRAAAAGLPVEVVDGPTRAEVLAAFGRADVVLSPSRTGPDGDAETLLMVNLEAQAAGRPVVTTRHGGIPEGVGPGAGILVPEGDVEALADALVALAADPARRAEMGRAGRAWIEAHGTAEESARRLAQLHTQTLANW